MVCLNSASRLNQTISLLLSLLKQHFYTSYTHVFWWRSCVVHLFYSFTTKEVSQRSQATKQSVSIYRPDTLCLFLVLSLYLYKFILHALYSGICLTLTLFYSSLVKEKSELTEEIKLPPSRPLTPTEQLTIMKCIDQEKQSLGDPSPSDLEVSKKNAKTLKMNSKRFSVFHGSW